MTNSPLSQYPVDMVAAVEIAMSAGYFYNDDLVPFVFKTIEAGRREYVLSSIVDLDVSAVGFLATCTEPLGPALVSHIKINGLPPMNLQPLPGWM